jgi:hypothetical protein
MASFVAAVLARTSPTEPPPIELVKRAHLGPLAFRLGVGELRNEYAASLVMAERRAQVIREVASAFGAREVRAALIKGAAYAGTIYPDAAERPMQDVDLLVPRAQLADAVRVMQELGFERVGMARKLSGYYHAIVFARDGLMVELHRSIVQVYRTDLRIGDLWRRARLDPHGSGAWRLDPVDELLVCAVHVARHELAVPVLNYVDVARQWDAFDQQTRESVHARANTYRIARAVAAVLAMTELLRSGRAGTPDLGVGSRVLPSTDDVLLGTRPSRVRQIGQKLYLVQGVRELVGLAYVYGGAFLQGELRSR